jgi:hypothetical protein
LKSLVSRLEEMTVELELDLDGVEEHRCLGWAGIVQETHTGIEEESLTPILDTWDVETT